MGLNKCIVFDLPSGAGGMAAGIYKSSVQRYLRELHEKYGLAYKSKTKVRQFKIWFEQDNHYTLFFLVYDFPRQWKKPYIIAEKY